MASAADSPLRRILVEEIAPVVMVISTPLAEHSCRKNGLDFVQMLRPFCVFENIDVPVRTASDQPYRLQEFRVRLFYASDVRKQTLEAADNLLKQVVSDKSEVSFPEPQVDDLNYKGVSTEYPLIGSESGEPPWFQNFNRELIRTLSFSEHEAFDYPIACLLVASTFDEQPIRRFSDLFNTEQLPSLFTEGIMDPKILKHYLLLHDNQNGNLERVGSIFAEMRSTFGSEISHLLCINSSQDAIVEGDNNPYSNVKKGEACFLNTDDLNQIRDFMQDICSKHIIPHMEHKVRDLNQQVSTTRKGFKNQIKNLWWRKGKEDIPEQTKGPLYTFNSIESQIRVLGDYAFMLFDYDLALSNYRLLSTDYKLDKSWKHYAGSQEMVGLCLFMLDQSRKDAEYCMESAFHSYERIGSSCLRYATRCGIWWAEMFKERRLFKEAATVYFRIASEEPSLNAAVVLEQAAYCYLLSDPPLLRKYAFHLVLAGNRYYISEQKKHAIRAYTCALSVYKENSWSYINDHVHFNIGRWYALTGRLDVAIAHMVKVLACSNQSPATQKLFVNDFFRIVQSTGSKTEVKMLQLPLINLPSLKVTFEDHRTYASSASVHVDETLWRTLEEGMVPSIYTAKSNWLETYKKLNVLKKSNEAAICVVGEPIKVYLEFKNPLQISISVSGVSLMCEHSPNPDQTELSEGPSTSASQGHEPLDPTGYREPELVTASYVLSSTSFVLGGGETRGVELDITPRIQGILKIIGVRWVVSDSVVGSYIFKMEVKGKRGKSSGREDDFGSTLCFVAVKGLPKLEGCIHKMPEKTYAGDLRRLILELKNQSEYPVKNLKMKISHPRFLIPGSLTDLKLNFLASSEKELLSEFSNMQEDILFDSNDNINGPFSFASVTGIQGGTNFCLPLWLHAGVPGKISLYISVYYEMENNSSDLTYRTLRMIYQIEVSPSLEISMSNNHCPTQFEESFLRVDIVNRTRAQNFQLCQLLSISSEQDLSAQLSNASGHISKLLLAGQSIVCFFKLKGQNNIHLLPSEGSHSEVLHEDNVKAILDNFKTPLINFHRHEGLHHLCAGQGSPSTAQFILLSHQGDYDPKEIPQLFSHHIKCSIESKSPIWWQLSGPHTITHDFHSSFHEADLHIKLHNSSPSAASVKIVIPENVLPKALLGEPSEDMKLSNYGQGGWQSDALQTGARLKKPLPLASSSLSVGDGQPFAWCRSSSSSLVLEPMSIVEVPMRVCLFSAGIHDLSNLELHWSLRLEKNNVTDQGIEDKRRFSGMSRGHPFYVTAIQMNS